MKVYLDNAATTPLAPEVFEAMAPVFQHQFGNPSSTHSFGREVKSLLEKSRKTIAQYLNCQPGEIIFTSGGTEADNMAIYGAVRDLGVTRIISSPIEHHAVLHTVEDAALKNVTLQFVKTDEKGCVDMHDLENKLKIAEPTLVSLMHANNEVATMIDLQAIGNLCKKYNAFFHSDTVQTMGHYAFDLKNTPVDFITCAAHKFHGPKGIGFLYMRNAIKLKPMIQGGAQERNFRGGTENIYGIVGLAKAFELAYSHLELHQLHISALKKHMISRLKKEFTDISFNGDSENENSLYTVLNVSFPPNEAGEMLLFKLDLAGVAVSGGSACSSGSNKGSHVLNALGVPSERHAIRFSFSRYTQMTDVDFAIEKLKEIFN
jgi:cysteine desulfurase